MREARLAKLFWLALTCVAVATAPASAGSSVKVTTQNYDISGANGAALMSAMDHKGPKHGLLTRAIAQTRYSVSWDLETAESGSDCRLKRATATLHLNYMYPRVSSQMSADLNRRWQRFMAGVRKHEEQHGAIARKMVQVAERSIAGLKIANDRGCRKVNAEMKRRVNAIYADYERRQESFDAREHRPNGNVEGLVGALIR